MFNYDCRYSQDLTEFLTSETESDSHLKEVRDLPDTISKPLYQFLYQPLVLFIDSDC